MDSPPLFEIRNARVRLGSKDVLRDFNLAIEPGEKRVVRGKSGSGKTTLLRLLLGFVQPDEGEVLIEGVTMSPEAAWRLRRQVAFLNQGIDLERGPVERALTRLCEFRSSHTHPDRKEIADALSRVDLPDSFLDKETSTLSGGERQRVGLSAALLLDQTTFLLDEPTAALDSGLKESVADCFLAGEPDWTVVVVSHDDAWNRPDTAEVLELVPEEEA
jgi:putative ABC transport system ATP-binding protein